MPSAQHLKELHRLINNTPSPAHANATIRLQGFIEVIEPFELRHLQRAVSMILNSEAEGIDPKYAIFPPVLAALCKQLRDRELTHEANRRGAVLQIQDRSKVFHEDPPEVRRAAVEAGLKRLSALNKPDETPEQVAAREAATAQHLAKHDSYFLASDSDDSRRKRLMGKRI